MNPYIIFKIKGIFGISILQSDENKFEVSECDDIKEIELLLENDDIVGIKVHFNTATIINENLIYSAYKKIELFVVNIVSDLQAAVTKLEIEIGDVYNPNSEGEDEPTKMTVIFNIKCSFAAKNSFAISRYANLFSQFPTSNKKQDAFVMLGNIMKIDNIAVRYLIQYEFLKSLISKKNQKGVTKYIRDIYNANSSFNTIGFQQTRLPNKTFQEDNLTYYRNILAHVDTSNISNDINEKISIMSIAMMQVIRFALNQMQ